MLNGNMSGEDRSITTIHIQQDSQVHLTPDRGHLTHCLDRSWVKWFNLHDDQQAYSGCRSGHVYKVGCYNVNNDTHLH